MTAPYREIRNPAIALTLEKLEKAPSGIDLGPLRPCLPERLFTKNKRIRLYAEMFITDLKRVGRKWSQGPAATNGRDLVLIGWRQLRSNNSWMHNSPRLVKGGNRCTALLHPYDAHRHNIHTGDIVRVLSRTGTIEIEAEVTEDIMPGVVSIPHGWGHNLPGVCLGTASHHAGVSANNLTDERFLDELSGTAAVNGVPICIERAG